MVKTLDSKYYDDPKNDSGMYGVFPFELSPFQKFAIDAIASGNHSLSCDRVRKNFTSNIRYHAFHRSH